MNDQAVVLRELIAMAGNSSRLTSKRDADASQQRAHESAQCSLECAIGFRPFAGMTRIRF